MNTEADSGALPSLPHPIESLRGEHRIVLTVLDQMEAECTRMTEHRGGLRPDLWRTLLAFFDGFHDRCHHLKEEQLLFPLLEATGLSTDGPTATLRREHERGRMWRLRIQEALDANDGQRVHAAATGFLDYQRKHIQTEDQLVFPLALRLLNAHDLRSLQIAFAACEDEAPPLPRAV